jgi:hypothetical protein
MAAEGEEQVCPVGWLIDEVGAYLSGDDDAEAARAVGRRAVTQGAQQVNELLRSAFAAHEVVATELRFTGARRGARRTVFAEQPTPVAVLLLCGRLCDIGDEVVVVHHTAAHGSTSREATWPFGMARAEELTRPPGRPNDDLATLDPDDITT